MGCRYMINNVECFVKFLDGGNEGYCCVSIADESFIISVKLLASIASPAP